MFARLRHDAIVGGNDQQRIVDSADARHHGVHQALVTRHVDESQDLAVRQCCVRISRLDRDAARLLLLEPVGIDAGERAHHAGFAVIDVSRGTDDHRSNASVRSAFCSHSSGLLLAR